MQKKALEMCQKKHKEAQAWNSLNCAYADLNGDRILDHQDLEMILLPSRNGTQATIDLTQDGRVNSLDYEQLKKCVEQETACQLPADYNGDGTVNEQDLEILSLKHMGKSGVIFFDQSTPYGEIVKMPNSGRAPVNIIIISMVENTSFEQVEDLVKQVNGKLRAYQSEQLVILEVPTKTISELEALIISISAMPEVEHAMPDYILEMN